ncbi:MAG: NUDIX domain-containing protein [Pedobacter sp.]|nr:MAG: NUDIX domain-containing protein [Pedobacter sp.]
MSYFNLRVYGILINANSEVLLSDEFEFGVKFTKFPGGGVEIGEGLREALAREFKEECEVEVEVLDHIYTTDFYEKSSFNESQILSVYYYVKTKTPLQVPIKSCVFDFQEGETQCFRWVPVAKLQITDLTFQTDQRVLQLIQSKA